MSMHRLLIATALIASVPAGTALAQQTRVTTTVTTPQPPVVNPEAARPTTVPPSAPVPATDQAGAPGSDGVIHEWGPQQPVAQAVPAPPAAYPPCTRGRADSCYNPDPRKEADTRADGTVGG
jgi:hypothetical protein